MSYVALYRKFRPQTFDQVRGQDHVVRALKNQLINKRIGHAYLFTGTRGTGKTSAAKIFAKAINCLHPVDGEPCNECENCRAIDAGNFVDVAEVDAASNNGVDDIRRIIEEVRYTPVSGEYKVFIIDEAHMITGAAFNAFLKTLEEPPAYAVFILATTEPHKLPITILSRCQRYDFRRITSDTIAENLADIVRNEGVEADEKALLYIARAGDGSMRDAVSILDKCIAFSLGDKLTYESVLSTLGTVDTEIFSELFRYIYAGNASEALKVTDRAIADGRDLTQFATDFIWYIRNILMVRAAGIRDPEMLGISQENLDLLLKDAAEVQPSTLMRYIRILSELISNIRYTAGKQVLLEVAVIRMAIPEMETDTDSLADRIRQLEAGFKSGAYHTGSAPSGGGPIEYDPYQAFEDDPYDPVYEMPPRMTNPDALAGLFDEETALPPVSQTAATGGAMRQTPVSYTDPVKENVPTAGNVQSAGNSEAVPEARQQGIKTPDLQTLWTEICASFPTARIRSLLHKCMAAPAEDDSLRIAAPSDMIYKQLKDEKVMELLRQTAQQAAGRAVVIQLTTGTENNSMSSARETFPEELLQKINFNIGTEEY